MIVVVPVRAVDREGRAQFGLEGASIGGTRERRWSN